MIQDIAPHIYNNQYAKKKTEDDSLILYFQEGKCLLNIEETEAGKKMTFLRKGELPDGLLKEDDLLYLFQIDEENYFLINPVKVKEPDVAQRVCDLLQAAGLKGYTMTDTGVFREVKEGDENYHYRAFAGITASQLQQWYGDNHFCGKCGKPLVHSDKERMLHCPVCGQIRYPQLCPAVIVAVTDGDRLLLTKYNGRAYTRYALIAGFTEIGETIEETVQREVMEEVGLKVKNIRYYKSQPWSFSGTVLMGYFCEVDGSREVRLDQEELSVAEWVERDRVPHGTDEISLTREMMHVFWEKGGMP